MTADSVPLLRHADEVLPPEVARLLAASEDTEREEAWARLLERHSALLLRVAHATLSERDDAMDSYACLLELLRADDYRRIRAYSADGRCKFTTWLVVVTRRACIDFARRKYGRRNGHPLTEGSAAALRRGLALHLRTAADVNLLVDEWLARPEGRMRSKELESLVGSSLRGLSAEDQLLIKLRFADNLAAREIAQVTGAPSPFHVYRRLNAILAALRRRLESVGVNDSAP